MPDWELGPISARQLPPLAVPGAILAGKYRLEGLIGHGGMGSVWAATHLGLDQKVAVKIVSPQYAQVPDIRRRFDVEAKAAARLRSRHVVQVFDNGELDDGTPYMVMEFLEGESLGRRLQRSGPLPLPECVRTMAHVARALAKAHEQGIVHRDIKPENIYLARSHDEESFVAKVLDFGIAKVAVEGEQSTTRTGALLGTPMFMSPEQARGMRSLDHRTDLFSLGLVAYSMLTGVPPFSSDSYGDLIVQICTQPLPILRATAPWVPNAVEAWFQQACAREPGARFQSAQQMGEAFVAACGDAATAAGVTGPGVASWPAPSGASYKASGGTAGPFSKTHPAVQGRSPRAILAMAVGGLVVCVLGIALAVRVTRGPGVPAAAVAPTQSDPTTVSAPPTSPVLLSPIVVVPSASAQPSTSASPSAAPPVGALLRPGRPPPSRPLRPPRPRDPPHRPPRRTSVFECARSSNPRGAPGRLCWSP